MCEKAISKCSEIKCYANYIYCVVRAKTFQRNKLRYIDFSYIFTYDEKHVLSYMYFYMEFAYHVNIFGGAIVDNTLTVSEFYKFLYES